MKGTLINNKYNYNFNNVHYYSFSPFPLLFVYNPTLLRNSHVVAHVSSREKFCTWSTLTVEKSCIVTFVLHAHLNFMPCDRLFWEYLSEQDSSNSSIFISFYIYIYFWGQSDNNVTFKFRITHSDIRFSIFFSFSSPSSFVVFSSLKPPRSTSSCGVYDHSAKRC